MIQNILHKMNKKGDFSWETLAKLILALVMLLFIAGIIFLAKDKIYSLLGKVTNIFRFGG